MSNNSEALYSALKTRVHVMGILNVTPDSFSDGGRFFSTEKAVVHAEQLIADGADILDIGGESTRPGAKPLTLKDELDRVLPVLRAIRKKSDIPISIDTYKTDVAKAALDEGADLINDISGMTMDEGIAGVAAQNDVPLVIMHIRGTPSQMQNNPSYDDVINEVKQFLETQCTKAQQMGACKLIIDPGFGFGKRYEDNFTLLKNLRTFTALGYPLMAGTSRKSFLGKAFDAPPANRLEGTLISNIYAVQQGATLLRVHDVSSMKRALHIHQMIETA
ncbi:MAG TPA: dihydropteroate synthase [bacterium]|nr:dihydropteroate synthase [bacterium]